MVMTWLLTWLSVSVATLNVTLQFLVIYRYRFLSTFFIHLYQFLYKYKNLVVIIFCLSYI